MKKRFIENVESNTDYHAYVRWMTGCAKFKGHYRIIICRPGWGAFRDIETNIFDFEKSNEAIEEAKKILSEY